MSLRALRTLVAIARHGSFSAAGNALGLTQSAVSLHVRALEDEFRCTLFDRSSRRPRLTDAGRLAVQRAEEILSSYEALGDALTGEPSLQGPFRLGAVHTALSGLLPEALARLKQEHPGLRVRINGGMSAELALLVEAGELDAAITTEPVRPYATRLSFTPLYSDAFWWVAAADVDLAAALESLEHQAFLRFDRRTWAGRMIDASLREQNLRVIDTMEMDSREALVRMASCGLGIAVVPLAERDLANLPAVQRLPFATPQLSRRIGFLEPEGRPKAHLTQVIQQIINDISS